MKTLPMILMVIATPVVLCQDFICVTQGLCSNAGTPDLRIVSSGVSQCPAGLVPCSTPLVISCGVRYIPPPTDQDGISTPGAFPWQVYMVNQSGIHFGSGVLIDQFHVLTAAHKVRGNEKAPETVQVYVGVWDPASMATATVRTATRIIMHPGFSAATLSNNVALIRLNAPLAIGMDPTVGCAVLPSQGQNFLGRRCIVSGWGQTDADPRRSLEGPQTQVTVPIVDYATCRASHASPNSLGSNVDVFLDPLGNICAGGEPLKDACTNDGGSPLVCPDMSTGRWTVAGLVLWGKGCGQAGVYGVYANVANYRNWIDSTVALLNSGGTPDLRNRNAG